MPDDFCPAQVGRRSFLRHAAPKERTPQSESGYHHPSWFAAHGYIVVVQDCRGRWASGGEFTPFLNEGEDGYDAIEWAARLPGSSGAVGMYGYSYPGLVQLLAAMERPPSLAAICPGFTSSQAYDGWIYSHGALFLGWALTWAFFLSHDTARRRGDDRALREVRQALLDVEDHYWRLPLDDLRPIREMPRYWSDWLEHPTYDDYWKRWSVDAAYERIDVPALHFTGWYDGFLRGTVDNYAGLTAAGRPDQRLIVWPWTHEPWTPVWGSEESDLGFMSADDAHIAWFDRHLKGVEPEARRRCGSTCSTRAGATSRLAAARHAHAASCSCARAGGRTPGTATAALSGRAAGRRAAGRLHLRPGPADLERGRPLLLRRVGHADGPGLPGRRRGDEVRPRLHERAAGARPAAGRRGRADPARGVHRARHRLRRPAVRGRPGGLLAQPPGGARPRPLPKRLRVPRAAHAGRAGGVRSGSGRWASGSRRAVACGWTSRAPTSRCGTAT